jgi:hypothetical protein
MDMNNSRNASKKKLSLKEKFASMGLVKKCVIFLILAAAVIGIICLAVYFIYYVGYNDYKLYLLGYEVEDGFEFAPVRENSPDVEGMELVAENDLLKFYTRLETGEVALYDKRNRVTVYSNPVNADGDKIANVSNVNYLKSQFIISYYNSDIKTANYDSHSMCVEKGQLTYEALKDGIRYIYDVGEYGDNRTGIIPVYITEEKLEEICGKLEEQDASSLRRFYGPSQSAAGMLELNRTSKQNPRIILRIQGWLDSIGWTEEEFTQMQEMAGAESAVPISFTVVLDYRLEGDSLVLSVPASLIEERGGGRIHRIQLLRYMGAANMEEEGYLVVPNGSGSLIRFNNGRTAAPNYSQYVYDVDLMIANFTTIENSEVARLPLYGICRKGSSVLSVIEGGRPLAYITANVSGVYNEYNYAYTSFVLRNADNLFMFGDSTQDIYVLEPDLYDVNMQVRYTLLTDEYEGYSGIANYYREKLISEGVLKEKDGSLGGDIPFYYDIVSGVEETAHFLGVGYLRTFPMTTFAQAGKISDELKAKGITNQVMNLQGWFNGGYYHDTANTVHVPWKLGGKSGLEELSSIVRENGGRFYADVVFQKVTWADRQFNFDAQGSRYFGGGYVASFGQVNPASLRMTAGLGYYETLYDLLSPKFLPRYVDKFSGKIVKYNIEGISLRDLGDVVYSDKKRTNIIDREQALQVVLGQLEKLAGTGKPLMVNAGNDYSFAYAADIINAPVDHSGFLIVDENIPLYQMILHGSIDYSGTLHNFLNNINREDSVLKLIEYGASPHYMFTWEESSRMKNTGLSRFYATTWGVWKQEAVEVYEAVNGALKHVTGEAIIKHEILGNGLRKITYGNGVAIYVNYGDREQTVDGITIPALSYGLEGI